MIRSMFVHLLGAPEEINGGERCPTYLYRWHIGRCRWFKAYLHHFVGEDWSRDLHDHPRRFITVGLWGSYVEETPNGFRRYRAPWVRSFAATHTHRLSVGPSGHCWTLALVFKITREWGFWHEGTWLHWKSYVFGEHKEVADKMKACGDSHE